MFFIFPQISPIHALFRSLMWTHTCNENYVLQFVQIVEYHKLCVRRFQLNNTFLGSRSSYDFYQYLFLNHSVKFYNITASERNVFISYFLGNSLDCFTRMLYYSLKYPYDKYEVCLKNTRAEVIKNVLD